MRHPAISDKDYEFVQQIIDTLIEPHRERIELGRKRQHNFHARRKNDVPPLTIHYYCDDFKELIQEISPLETDREYFRVLCNWLRVCAVMLQGNSDWQPFIYSQFGTGVNLACVGLEPTLIKETASYGPPHPLGYEKAAELTVDDIKLRGTFAKALDFISYARQITDDRMDTLYPDLQAPFSLACMIMGDEFFLKCIEDRNFIHQFLDFCVDLFCQSFEWSEGVCGCRGRKTYHIGGGNNFSTRACALSVDHAVMFSPDMIDEFVIPSSVEVAKRLGAKIKFHYCGWYEYLSCAAALAPEITELNHGIIPRKEQEQDFDLTMRICDQSGTLYGGDWPPHPGENARRYLDRLHKWASRGILMPAISYKRLDMCEGGNPFASPAEVYDYWQQK